MKFKVGDIVKFREFENLPDWLRDPDREITNNFHKKNVGKIANVTEVQERSSTDTRIIIDLNEAGLFCFRKERFMKIHSEIELDSNLFQL